MSENIITKQCSNCKEIKPISEFHKSRSVKDGLQRKCRDCEKVYYQSEKGKSAAKHYQQSNRGKTAQRRYEQSEKGKITASRRTLQMATKYPKKKKARNITNNAIITGKLSRPDTLKCKYCPKQAEQYHHPDYSKPLDVEPICCICHRKNHN